MSEHEYMTDSEIELETAIENHAGDVFAQAAKMRRHAQVYLQVTKARATSSPGKMFTHVDPQFFDGCAQHFDELATMFREMSKEIREAKRRGQ